jgi:UDP-2-acetamido-3-amino-2,3-dideoxy-glucuronate N-acetyltransferase
MLWTRDRRRPAVRGQFVVIEPDVSIGEGTSIWNLVYVGQAAVIGCNVTIATLVHIAAGTTVGDGTTIQASACIGHNAHIGKDCFVGPGVVMNADPYPPIRRVTGSAAWESVTIEDEAIIGAGAILNAGVTIGQRAVVGMGAIVTSDGGRPVSAKASRVVSSGAARSRVVGPIGIGRPRAPGVGEGAKGEGVGVSANAWPLPSPNQARIARFVFLTTR